MPNDDVVSVCLLHARRVRRLSVVGVAELDQPLLRLLPLGLPQQHSTAALQQHSTAALQ